MYNARHLLLMDYCCIVYHFVFQYIQMKWKKHMLSFFNPLYAYYYDQHFGIFSRHHIYLTLWCGVFRRTSIYLEYFKILTCDVTYQKKILTCNVLCLLLYNFSVSFVGRLCSQINVSFNGKVSNYFKKKTDL